MHYCQSSQSNPLHQWYHDHEYGFPKHTDQALFELFSLEIMQAGLSWLTVLQKRSALRSAFADFIPQQVACFDAHDVLRLCSDVTIIRNQLKINSIIYNAKRITCLINKHGSFQHWLMQFHPRSQSEWLLCFKREFKFVGPEIIAEFLMSSGWLAGAHQFSCPIYQKVLSQCPMWSR